MKVQFLGPAWAEFVEAVNYYDNQGEGLGFEFSEDIRKTIERIIQYPEAWPLISERTRRCRTKRFPYGTIYQVKGDTLLVVAVMHLHREPESWKKRIPKPRQ